MKRLAAVIALVALALTSCGGGGGVPTGQVEGHAVRVTNETKPALAGLNVPATGEEPAFGRLYTRTNEAPSLLRDNSDPNTFYLSAAELLSGNCRFFRSPDGGDTWEELPAPQLEPYTNCGLGSVGPQNIRTDLEQAPNGTIYYAYHAQDPADKNGTRSVLLGRSTNGGQSWQTTVVSAAPKPRGKQPIQVNFEPHLAIDPDNPNRVYVMWRRSYSSQIPDGEAPPTRPWMAVSHDGGKTFGEPFMMLDKDLGFDGPRPIVVGDRLYAFYRISAPDTPEGAAPAKTKIFSAVSTDEGRTWKEHLITAQLGSSEPVPLYDEQRDVFYVVWHDNRNGDLDIFFSKSQNAAKWSKPVRLNDDPVKNDIGQYYPQISQAPNGRIDVSWYDYRDDSYPPPQPETPGEPLGLGSNLGTWQTVYTTHSFDGGETWSANVRVDPATRIDRTMGTWNGDYFVVVPTSVASSNDQTLVAWSGTRDGTAKTQAQDIYTNQISYQGDGGFSSLFTALIALFATAVGAGLALLATVLVARRRPRKAKGSAT